MRKVMSFLVVAVLASGLASAQNVPSGFVVDTILSSGLDAPHCLGLDSLGRLFVGERGGQIHVVVNGNRTAIGTVPSIQTGSERGLLAVQPSPNFTTDGQLFVWCSRTTSPNMELLRYTCTGQLNNASSGAISFSAASERVVLNSAPDGAFNHNGGTIIFSPIDDMLLLSIGDDNSCPTAQSTNNLSGTIVRIDVSGLPAGPSSTAPSFSSLDPGDNPASGSNTVNAIIMDFGLRNPWRMTHDVITGDLYIADVGQNAIEEFNQRDYSNPGTRVNFGWPYKEGTLNSNFCGGFGGTIPGLTDPIVEVTHSSGWFSGFAGFFYRHIPGSPDSFGLGYDRIWIYGDYFSGQLRALMDNGNGTWSPLPPVAGQPSTANWGTGFSGITQCVQHQDGSIYFTQHSGPNNFNGGFLKRIRPLGPTDVITVQSGDGQVGLVDEIFANPVEIQVSDSQTGLPLAGVTVNFSVTAGSVVGSNAVVTDVNGLASVTVQADSTGGDVTVSMSTSNMGSNAASLFARGLSVTLTQVPFADIIVTSLQNQSALPQVPLIFALALDTIPPVATPIGNICVDVFGGTDTFVFEDAFSGISSNTVPPFGTPGRFANYFGNPGTIPAGTYRFQYLWDDPTTLNSVQGQIPFRVGISNCVIVTAQ